MSEDKKLESIIFGLKEEISEQKAEIERLTEDNKRLNELLVGGTEVIDYWNNKYLEERAKNDELQEQVDELKEELDKAYEIERANIQAEIADAGTSCHWCEQQTVKDTAKEIFGFVIDHRNSDFLLYDLDNFIKERYGVEVE